MGGDRGEAVAMTTKEMQGAIRELRKRQFAYEAEMNSVANSINVLSQTQKSLASSMATLAEKIDGMDKRRLGLI